MKCDFCKRDENEIKNIFAPIIESFMKDIADKDAHITEIKKQYPIKHGFISDKFERAKKINEDILDIKLNAIMANLDPFFKLDPNIELLTSYYTNYKPAIIPESTLKDLLELFLKEPTEERLSDEVRKFVDQRDSLYGYIEIINKKNEFFECKIINDIIIPLRVFAFENSIISAVLPIIRKKPIKRTITLCPYCKYLFNEENANKITDDHSSLKNWDFDR
ncbi:MAG: hypothetical protein LBT11_03460 [Treponema sp.]|jgi:hypothetical protein|nr:hypothetical protein [Treponema sp.]